MYLTNLNDITELYISKQTHSMGFDSIITFVHVIVAALYHQSEAEVLMIKICCEDLVGLAT